MSYSWWFGDARSHNATSSSQRRLKGPMRASAAALGISTDELVRQLFAAKELDDVRPLAEKLGVVGDDDTIDAVMPLVQDSREGVPELLVSAFGAIATEHAVDILIKTTTDPRDDVRTAAVDALGVTHNPRAESTLVEIALRTDDAARVSAMFALADFGTERAIGVLAQIASHPTEDASNAVRALARIESPAAKAAIAALVDSPSLIVAGFAIGELKEIDEDMVAKLAAIVEGGERDLVPAALNALARAGEVGLPLLKAAALDG